MAQAAPAATRAAAPPPIAPEAATQTVSSILNTTRRRPTSRASTNLTGNSSYSSLAARSILGSPMN